MDKKPEERSDTFDDTAFGKRVAEIKVDPGLLDTKEKLIEFWQLALKERGRIRGIQAAIAFAAAREKGDAGGIDNRRPEDKSYIDIVAQFMRMDHMGTMDIGVKKPTGNEPYPDIGIRLITPTSGLCRRGVGRCWWAGCQGG